MMIHLYTGNGGGKTTAALGLALRALGHNKKVIVIQFMKGRKGTGEYLVKKKLGPKYEIYQFGRPKFVNLRNPAKEDIDIAKKGLAFTEKLLKKKPDILILDEINVAVYAKLITINEIKKLLKKVPKKTWVVMTGRYAPKSMWKISDFVTEFVDRKRPKKMHYEKGIEW
jgi:cob(I)alamin adenosyltransferase